MSSDVKNGAAEALAGAEMTTPEILTERLFGDADAGPIEPLALFEEWFSAAVANEPNDPHAMALATVDASGAPDVRIVLMNGRDQRGLTFFTNFESDKGRQLLANPVAAAVFHWKSIRRQLRLRGPVEVVTDAEADAYFASRPRESRIASTASHQSRPLRSRQELMASFEALGAQFGAAEIPRPSHWSGFRLVPMSMEFWRDGLHRLHDRIRFSRAGSEAPWLHQRLYP